MNNILLNENKEGFKHKGNGFVAGKPLKLEEIGELSTNEKLLVDSVKMSYQVSSGVAYLFIMSIYKGIKSIFNIMIDMIKQFGNIIEPILDFMSRFLKIIGGIIKKMYYKFIGAIKRIFYIMRNLPQFIKKYANKAINFITSIVTQSGGILSKLIDIAQIIFQGLIQLPQMIFDITGGLMSFGLNMFTIIMKAPVSIVNAGLKLQDKMTSFM